MKYLYWIAGVILVLFVAFGIFRVYELGEFPEVLPSARKTLSPQEVMDGWVSYTDPLNRISLQYPAKYLLVLNEDIQDGKSIHFYTTTRRNTLDGFEFHAEIGKPTETTTCYYYLCDAPGNPEKFNSATWTHIARPYKCWGEVCPTDESEFFRATSSDGWTYYARFNSVEEAQLILPTVSIP